MLAVAGDGELVEVCCGHLVQWGECEVVDDQDAGGGEAAVFGLGGVVEAGGFEFLEQLVGAGHVDGQAAADGDVAEGGGQVRFADPDREPDRLQHLRAVLPCEVRVVSVTHPLSGRLLEAVSFKRWNGELLLVVTLPDGSPGTVRAGDTSVFGDDSVPRGGGVVLDAAGIRELRRLVTVMRGGGGRTSVSGSDGSR